MKKFLLILLFPALYGSAQVTTAGSYLNTSRVAGGPVQTGDVLEIRAVISVSAGTNITALTFTDAVPGNTNFVSGSLKAVTNEGVVVSGIANTGNYTDATNDDRGKISGSNITINMGDAATKTAGGSVTGGTTTPLFYSSQSILMAAYRVTVTGTPGTTITLGGKFAYNDGTNQSITLPAKTISILAPVTCGSNSSSNLVTAVSNGNFSTGTTQNAASSANVTGFNYQTITANKPADGEYSIIKNTSPTQYSGSTPASADKVFGVWDVIGDHTGNSGGTGNNPSANAATGGYMLAVNASFAPATVFTAAMSGLSKNTNYTYSIWIRNICAVCGADPTANASSGTPGVKPNLAFSVNGNDYYTTGEIAYSGSWVQKTFTFNSGNTTSATIAIKNNAPGGGGNDWVIDDISLTQCFTILPVKLTSFSATTVDTGNRINWTTDQEINTASFVVQKSVDGSDFNDIATIVATNRYSGASYEYTDRNNAQPVTYYRLKMIDRDGQFAYSKILSIKSIIIATGELTVFPNPAREETTVHFMAAATGQVQLTLFSVSGSIAKQMTASVTKGSNTLHLAVSSLGEGMYTLKLAMGNNIIIGRVMVIK